MTDDISRVLFVGDSSEYDTLRFGAERFGHEFEFRRIADSTALDGSSGALTASCDVIILGSRLESPLTTARRIRRSSGNAQVVFVVEPARLERFRAGLPFVPHLASSWTVSAAADPAETARTMRDAARASRARASSARFADRINRQLANVGSSSAEQMRRSQLALSASYLATLMNQSPDAFLAVDPHADLVAFNDAARALFGLDDAALGAPIAASLPQDLGAEMGEAVARTMQGEEGLRFEFPLGATFLEISVAPVYDGARIASVSIAARDITARKRAEEELRELNRTLEARVAQAIEEREQAEAALRQAQKMEAVGQLTGGIAHDFNNMLSVIMGSLDLLKRRQDPSDARMRRHIDAALEGAQRAASLTQRLLAFSRRQPLRPQTLDANKLVSGMSELLRGSLGGDVRLETVLAGGLWRTHADPNLLENVILNLAVNARDAMVEGGRLTVETQNAHLDDAYAAAHPEVFAGQYVMIAVSDTGAGMSPEVLTKAFDPFFTTKEVGKGTGLGLSQVYGFVKQSGGHVKIYSEPGEGTTVKIYLPRLLHEHEEEVERMRRADAPLGSDQEVVLVVEDEPSVRQFSVEALTELGYHVLEADSALMALRLIDAHPEITLLFTDIVMPEVNGRKLAEEALRRRPDLKVLYTTGYTRNAIVHNGVLDPGVELIGKPFTIDQLGAKVRTVLDAALSSGRGGSS